MLESPKPLERAKDYEERVPYDASEPLMVRVPRRRSGIYKEGVIDAKTRRHGLSPYASLV